VIDAWPELPQAIRAGIVARVKVASSMVTPRRTLPRDGEISHAQFFVPAPNQRWRGDPELIEERLTLNHKEPARSQELRIADLWPAT
jgi:hypothetical protein